MSKSPTELTMDACRKKGWIVARAERWNPFAGPLVACRCRCCRGRRIGIRQDLFGLVDVEAIDEDGTTIYIQATTRNLMSDHYRKIMDDSELRRTVRRMIKHNRVCIVGWDQPGGPRERHRGKWRFFTNRDFVAHWNNKAAPWRAAVLDES
jgi:hypothetical protein